MRGAWIQTDLEKGSTRFAISWIGEGGNGGRRGQNRVVKNDSKVFGLATRRLELPFTEMQLQFGGWEEDQELILDTDIQMELSSALVF